MDARPPHRSASTLSVDEVVDDRATVRGLQPDLQAALDLASGALADPLRPAVLHDLPLQAGPEPVEDARCVELGPDDVGLGAHKGLVDDVDHWRPATWKHKETV